MFIHKRVPHTQFSSILPGSHMLVVTKTDIHHGKEVIPLAGSVAALKTNNYGMFDRNTGATLTITATDKRQIVYVFTAPVGGKGGMSRRVAAKLTQLTARINNAAIKAQQEDEIKLSKVMDF